MPWCEPCERFWNPASVTTEGTCPACGAAVDTPAPATRCRTPWHFWLVLAAATIYLGWRAIQGIALLL
ncbi:hypothetical protein [Candidatus Poriferisocius sp.]|uniref:hypothetical protein n=1 Tax=Candidatus Poriferisocius sp. TaxID=3101276 RepID=UPI003B0200CE